jgi:CRISPR-associated endonuclease Csy4
MQLRSTSTGQSLMVFIENGPLQLEPVAGGFNAYGLSQEGTIPWRRSFFCGARVVL